jgi:hypothetical protein
VSLQQGAGGPINSAPFLLPDFDFSATPPRIARDRARDSALSPATRWGWVGADGVRGFCAYGDLGCSEEVKADHKMLDMVLIWFGYCLSLMRDEWVDVPCLLRQGGAERSEGRIILQIQAELSLGF